MISYKKRQKIRTIIRRRLSKLENFLKPLYHRFQDALNKKGKERILNLGEIDIGKTMYIIRINNMHAGLFSLINSVVSHINYADSRGWIPIVDLKNFKNVYSDDSEIGRRNLWELYFLQPSLVNGITISLEDAYHCKNAILSSDKSVLIKSNLNANTIDDKKEFSHYLYLYKKYIRYNKSVIQKIDELSKEYFGNNKILGVSLRGTDYILSKPYGHPIQPTIEEAVLLVKKKVLEWNIDKIYLSTEDDSYVERFKEEFQGKLIIYNRKYIKVNNNNKSETVFEQIKSSVLDNNYNMLDVAYDYLCSSLLLTKCSSVILSRTGVTPFLLFGSKYENQYIWNKGLYGIDD